MAGFFLTESLQPRFFDALAAEGRIVGPTVTGDDVASFQPVSSLSDVALDVCRTLIPPKKLLLPPRETILSFSPEEGYRHPETDSGPTVLFGLHPCDLHAIALLDRIFLGSIIDPLYRSRRERLFLVGHSCEPDLYCGCDAVRCREPVGFDLFLQRVPEGIFVRSGSGRGDLFLWRHEELLSAEVAPFEPECPRGEPAAARELPDSPLWEVFARQCLSCGACSACCPTCACFDVGEAACLDGATAVRGREWDNCLFVDHGRIAGGTSFRESRADRLRYRFRHKFAGFGPLRGTVSCVGCGRCRVVCPAGIDLRKISDGMGEST